MKINSWLLIMTMLTTVCSLRAEVVITSPTGLPDESDVVLEKVVDSIRETPADTVAVVGDSIGFVAEELRNTTHGVTSALKGKTTRETVSRDLIGQVNEAWDISDEVHMRAYKVSKKMDTEMVRDAGSEALVLDVRGFFMGIDFPKGTSAIYRPEFNRLVVHQTPANLMTIDQMMGRFNQKPDYRQVEVETKFIEVEQKTLNELGFNWDFRDSWKMSESWVAELADQTLSGTLRSAVEAFAGGPAAGTMILTKDGWLPLRLAIRALEQSSGADTLSSPRVTTQDGTPAEIWVGDREMMPTEFLDGSQGTSVFADYQGWEQKIMGVHLKVTPNITKQGLINLELNPEVIDLIGYDTYDITPSNANMLMWAGFPIYYTSQLGRYPIPNISGVAESAWNLLSATLSGRDPNEQAFNQVYDYNLTGSGEPAGTLSATYIRDYEHTYEGNVNNGYYDNRRAQTHEEFGVAVPQVKASLPVFRVRKITTNMTVADGSTVGMGGLIYNKLETYKDKLPVLGSIPLVGRLFRSEGVRNVKRNLMIFVTATQVDGNGIRSLDMATR